jgi:hypothetical protein
MVLSPPLNAASALSALEDVGRSGPAICPVMKLPGRTLMPWKNQIAPKSTRRAADHVQGGFMRCLA